MKEERASTSLDRRSPMTGAAHPLLARARRQSSAPPLAGRAAYHRCTVRLAPSVHLALALGGANAGHSIRVAERVSANPRPPRASRDPREHCNLPNSKIGFSHWLARGALRVTRIRRLAPGEIVGSWLCRSSGSGCLAPREGDNAVTAHVSAFRRNAVVLEEETAGPTTLDRCGRTVARWFAKRCQAIRLPVTFEIRV